MNHHHLNCLSNVRMVALALAIAFVIMGTPALSQDVLEGEVRKQGFDIIPMALPMAAIVGDLEDESRILTKIVRDDLEFSGFFRIVDPALYHLVPDEPVGEVDHDGWLGIGAEAVCKIELRPQEDRIAIRVYVFDTETQKTRLAKAFTGRKEILRRTAHWISDAIIQAYTGRKSATLSQIAYVQKNGPHKDVYIMDYDGGNKRRLTQSNTINISPVWSKEGDRLAYVSWRSGRPDVWIVNTEGQVSKAPTINAELTAAPDWSPDGTKIVYTSDHPGNSEIYVYDFKTGRNVRLTRHGAIDTAPAFAPNGREIAFVSDRAGSPQIYVMDSEGLNVRRITQFGSYHESPAWSPDGAKLAYVSRIEGRFQLVIHDLGSGSVIQITSGRGNKENPRWSPDGRHLVFSGNETGSYEIYSIRTDGTGLRRLTREGGAFTPDWSR